jgi:hypothetical protein
MIFILLLGGMLQTASNNSPVYAQDEEEITPTPTAKAPRITKITVPFTRYRWWLIRYSNNYIECSFPIEHDGLPDGDDIAGNCTDKVYEEWLTSIPCDLAKIDSYSQCPGFYLQQIRADTSERQIEIELPSPTVWVSIANCNPEPPDNRCTTLPGLLLTAEEPLPNESIINVQGTLNGMPFSCPSYACILPLPPTGDDGVVVEFWADSSFGDSTEHYTARVRMIPWGDFMNPETQSNDPNRWYVDILSDQYRDGKLATCSDVWQVFPSLGGPPEWLSSPNESIDLQSDISYYYLAGALITYGVSDASSCLDGGLQAPNIASACGVEAARPQLLEWQNRFDGEIMQVARDTGVPARLLKNVFSRESQIWPGIYKTYREAGLGQLTDNGADTILLWNPEFFAQFCPLMLDQQFCSLGWGNLGEFEQNLLRGALVNKVNASCPDCPAGIDLTDADYSVRVFAEGMLANCEQVSRIITNYTGVNPGQVSSYDDLWRYTLVNYNAGAGCLSNAIESAWNIDQTLDWQTVSSYLEPACQGSIGYVEDISRSLKPSPTPTTWLPFESDFATPVLPRVLFTPTPSPTPEIFTPTFTPQPTIEPTQSGSATITPTEEGYPYPEPETETPYP